MKHFKGFLFTVMLIGVAPWMPSCVKSYPTSTGNTPTPTLPPATASSTPSGTASLTRTSTPTATLASTSTPTNTPVNTLSPTGTSTPSVTATSTASRTATPSATPTASRTPTSSPTSTGTTAATSTLTATGTPSSTSSSTATSSPTPSPTNTSAVSPTATATATTTTITIPSGLFVVAAFAGNVQTLAGFPITITNDLVGISINRAAEDTDSVTLITPVEGAIPLTWAQDVNFGTYVQSQYNTAAQFTYVPNGVYSIAVSTSLGTASSTMNAPGQITFNSNGSSVTATYPGNYDSAQVQETSPSPVTTYVSATGVNVGSPFSYPGSAYASAPATYVATYSAALTVFSFTGTGSATGSFVGDQVNLSSFTR